MLQTSPSFTLYGPIRHKLAQWFVVAAGVLCADFAAAADNSLAGRVDFAADGVTATSPAGQIRPLLKGTEIFSGDNIKTGKGRVQIRFTDGGQMSLQPDTQFRIADYHFSGKADGSEKGIFSFIKGGLRSITGTIGHVNKQNYRVETPVAVIGVRGTQYFAQLSNILMLTCGQGICVLTNQSGELVLNAGECGKVTDALTAPIPCEDTLTHKVDEHLADTDFVYSSSEDRDSLGNLRGITNGSPCPPDCPEYNTSLGRGTTR